MPEDKAVVLATRLVDTFGSLAGVLAASPQRIARVTAEGPGAVLLVCVRAASLHSLRHEALNGPMLTDGWAVRNYLFAAMAHEMTEGLRAFYLDSRNRLVCEELIGRGGITEVTFSIREIVRVALDHGATALIVVHNHPSGDPTPSQADTEMTRKLFQACRLFDIVLHDHLIVARSGFYSFRAEGLL